MLLERRRKCAPGSPDRGRPPWPHVRGAAVTAAAPASAAAGAQRTGGGIARESARRRSPLLRRGVCEILPVNDDGLLAEQRAYYQARAPEYDEWWQRRGRFDRGPELAEEWNREVAQVAAALETFGATGDVLELAGGTGWWTARLARTAGHLTVVDSSPETLELNRKRVARPDVDYLVADLFTGSRRGPMTSSSSRSGSLTCRGHDFRASGPWCDPVLHRAVGFSSSTTATSRTRLARSRTPTSSDAARIWSSAACTTEGSSRSSRSSTSRRSCSHFSVTKAGRQGSMRRAGSSSEKHASLTPGSPPGVAARRACARRIRVLRHLQEET